MSLNGQWETMPSVAPPDECLPLELRHPEAEADAESHILRGQALVDGYGHGVTHLWGDDGTLLATASQTCIMRRPG